VNSTRIARDAGVATATFVCEFAAAFEVSRKGTDLPVDWSWTGWPAVGSIAQLMALVAAATTVVIFWKQLEEMRKQLRDTHKQYRTDRQNAATPLAWFQFSGTTIDTETRMRALVTVKAAGAGIAHGAKLLFEPDQKDPHFLVLKPELGTLVAPNDASSPITWDSLIEDVGGKLSLQFFNALNEPCTWTQRVALPGDHRTPRLEGGAVLRFPNQTDSPHGLTETVGSEEKSKPSDWFVHVMRSAWGTRDTG
jgi:hypothetical protein